MKKIALMVVMAVCCAFVNTPAWGQKLELLVNDGVNFSTLVGLKDVETKTGIYSELGVGYKFNDRLGLEVDIAFSEQGAMSVVDGSSYLYDFSYLNIPLLATYTLPKQHLTFLAGVQAGQFVSATYSYQAPSVVGEGFVSGEGKFDKSEFHPWDVGFSVGARWVVIPSWGFGLEVRYTLGITQTHNGISDSMSSNPYISVPDNRNSVLRVGMSWALWGK
ncbi:MAG: PorT family protein [Tidjanibacter sp.]|nr:PorT family protein [Tidjanibacter sp.]